MTLHASDGEEDTVSSYPPSQANKNMNASPCKSKKNNAHCKSAKEVYSSESEEFSSDSSTGSETDSSDSSESSVSDLSEDEVDKHEVCYRFNKEKCSFGQNCKYEHQCSHCSKTGHAATVCHCKK